jgi:alpha-L-rhamnosidase
MTTAIDLRCEYLAHPLGVDVPGPRLSWTLWSDERGQQQTAYRILVASTPELLEQGRADLWDSGKVDSDRTCHVAYAGKPLRSLQRCYWKVQVWDRYGQPSDWSEVTWWEMGILSPDGWQAKWIRAPIAEPAPLFRKEFAVWSGLQRARALICGLGYYELYLNGKRIGEQVLDPAQTDYDRRAFYVVHDVTDALREGINCVGVMLGNGWFHQAIVWGGMSYGEPVLLLQLILEYEDGRVETVCTDESWKTTSGPVLKNNVYAGEEYDGRREIPGWNEPGLDDSRWQSVRMVPAPTQSLQSQLMPPIKRTRVFPPAGSHQPPAGSLDL